MPDGLVIAFANLEIVFDDDAERRHGEPDDRQLFFALIIDFKKQPPVLGRKLQAVGPFLAVQKAEGIFFQKVIDGNAPLMLGLRRRAGANAGIEIDSNEAVFFGACHETRLDGKPAKALVTVIGRKIGGPGSAQILQLQIKIFNIELDGAVRRKCENHRA